MSGESPISSLQDLKIRIFADGADLDTIAELYEQKFVQGFTTNPTLMMKAGVTNYMLFARTVLAMVTDLPVSFEVISDEVEEMREQARRLSDLAENVYVKIPITNARQQSLLPLIHDLTQRGINVNVTAIMTLDQVKGVVQAINDDASVFVSVFAGRISDTGRDPVPLMREALELLRPRRGARLLWASPREALNILQAEQIGCHIITATPGLLAKAEHCFGKNLDEFSLETVKMFYRDARASGFTIGDD